jgi:hypothetical protein
MANLAAVSPEFEEMIIGNTWTKCFFKLGSIDSAEKAAELIGKERKFLYTVSSNASESASVQALRVTPESSQSESGSVGRSWRQMEDYRVPTQKLTRLGKGECIVISGSRTFHIGTQALKFPKDIPPFKRNEYRKTMPEGLSELGLEGSYARFLVDGRPHLEPEEGAARGPL